MQVAITDHSFPNLEIDQGILQEQGFQRVGGPFKTLETLIPLVRDADAVITPFASVKAGVMAAMQRNFPTS